MIYCQQTFFMNSFKVLTIQILLYSTVFSLSLTKKTQLYKCQYIDSEV